MLTLVRSPLFGCRESREHSRHYLQALLVQSGERRNAENLSETVLAAELPVEDEVGVGDAAAGLGAGASEIRMSCRGGRRLRDVAALPGQTGSSGDALRLGPSGELYGGASGAPVDQAGLPRPGAAPQAQAGGRLQVAYRDREERRGAGRVRDPHLGGLASSSRPVPAGWGVSPEPATGLGGKDAPDHPAAGVPGGAGDAAPGETRAG